MSTLQIVLPGASFPSTFPKAYPDPILTDGSLLLLDFSHPSGWDLGNMLPVNGDIIPNIAYQQAAAILGGGTRTSLSSTFSQANLTGASSSIHKLEFSTRKGLHSIVSQNPGLPSNAAMSLSIAPAIMSYIFANTPGRDFYFALWRRTTRGQAAGSDAQPFSAVANNTSAFLYYHNPSAIQMAGTDKFMDNSPNGLTPHFSSWKVNAWFGTKPGSDPFNKWAWLVGRAGSWNGANATTVGSQIFYRFHIADLGLSGLTYDQMRAIDYALYVKEVLTPGGKFYNDTFTDPTTIP